jgi:hypothetical protein
LKHLSFSNPFLTRPGPPCPPSQGAVTSNAGTLLAEKNLSALYANYVTAAAQAGVASPALFTNNNNFTNNVAAAAAAQLLGGGTTLSGLSGGGMRRRWTISGIEGGRGLEGATLMYMYSVGERKKPHLFPISSLYYQ